MGGNLMQMLQQYGGGVTTQPYRGGGNLGGGLGLANGGQMPIQGGGGYDGQATSPFEVGGNSGGGGFRWPAWMGPAPQNQLYGSGGPISAGNGYGAGQLPGGFGYGGGQGAGGGGGIGAGGPLGGGRDGSGGMLGRRNPGTRDDQRRAYWDRGMNDQGGQQQMPQRPMGGYWQRPMGGPMPGQGIPLGAGGREMPMPGQAPQMQMPQTQGGMIKSAAPQQQQSYQPAQAPAQAQAPQQPVRRATRDDNNVRGWSGY